jgi:diaminopimelate decarboxylase
MFSKDLIQQLKEVETPFYYYDLELLHQTLTVVKQAADKRNFHVHFAYKANYNDRILNMIHDFGFGADCVSGNEVQKAIEIGVSPDKIAFAGVGKSDKEINLALDHSIF